MVPSEPAWALFIVRVAPDVLVFLAPALVFLELRLGGRLLLTELLLLAALPPLVYWSGSRLRARQPRLILALGLLWFLSQVATDVVRSTSFVDLARGWSKILFTLFNFATIYLLVGDQRRRLLLFSFGLCVGWFLAFLINPHEYASSDPWKFGVGTPVTVFFITIASTWPINRIRAAQVAITGGLGLLNFVMGFRLMGGACMLTSIYVILSLSFPAQRTVPIARIGFSKSIFLYCSAFLVLYIVYMVYCYAVSGGYFGEDSRMKYELQSSGRYGVLLGGRPEALASLNAILDSPIIGHGSWARDDRYIDDLRRLQDYGYDTGTIILEYERSDVIPSHSYLMGAWVEAGFLGALFWAVAFSRLPGLLLRYISVAEPASPLFVYLLLRFAWDILFSPFGHDGRVTAAYSLVVVLFLSSRAGGSAARPPGNP